MQGDAATATITGRVTAELGGRAVSGALVRAASPAKHMQDLRSSPGLPRVENTTDQAGNYVLVVPVGPGETDVSLDAFHPGLRSSAGACMYGGDFAQVRVVSGGAASYDFALPEALYLAGMVTDERGVAIAGAEVTATLQEEHSLGYVTRVVTGADGRFEVFDYPPVCPEGHRGEIAFEHPHHLRTAVDDIYRLTEEQRRDLRITMPDGRSIRGWVLDSRGEPVAGVMVAAEFDSWQDRKATLSNADGGFDLRGLTDQECLLTVHAMALREKAAVRLSLESDHEEVVLRLASVAGVPSGETRAVLGMTVVDVTPELRELYDLWNEAGALVLDPGAEHRRLRIGTLNEGDCFWLVGETRVRSVSELVRQLLLSTEREADGSGRCRVVYSFSRVDFAGASTRYMALTAAELAELERLSQTDL